MLTPAKKSPSTISPSVLLSLQYDLREFPIIAPRAKPLTKGMASSILRCPSEACDSEELRLVKSIVKSEVPTASLMGMPKTLIMTGVLRNPPPIPNRPAATPEEPPNRTAAQSPTW